jgi:hypothetical protein
MPTVIPPLTGRASKFTSEEARTLREEMLAILRSEHQSLKSPASHPSLSVQDFPAPSPRSKPLEVWNGSVCVRIYKTKWRDKKRRKLYRSHTLIWRDAGKRFRQKLSRLEEAKKRASQIAGAIANGETNRLQFTQADIASLLRAQELLRTAAVSETSRRDDQPPISLELAISHFVQWINKLGSAAAVDHALQFFIEHQPKGVLPKNTPALAEQLLAEKKRLGCGVKWLTELEALLKFWTEKFTGPLYAIRAHEISSHLDAPNVSLRTRKNRLAVFRELARFAQAKDQLSRTWNELALVDDPELPPVEVEIYAPQQIVKLLNATRPNMIPFTALQAFAGIRHEEMNGTKALLDWRDINLERGSIKIKKTVGKTKKQRLIEMQPNLIAWLKPYAKISGRICELSHTDNALVRAKHRAGIPAGRGQLTNALRASFISYRLAQTDDIGLVAREAGNSPNIIREHYLELVTKAEARRWFDIWPQHAEFLQLPLAGLA